MSGLSTRAAAGRIVAVAGIICAFLAVGEFVPASSAPPLVMLRSAQTTSLAIATPAQPVAAQASARFTHTSAIEVDLSATANAPADCDRCASRAVTTQLVYADRAVTVHADNAAAAWSTKCARCSGWALSLQVVITRDAAQVSANNRALAVNAGCVRCRAKAAAVQFVVRTRSPGRLTVGALAEIRQLRGQLLRTIRTTPASPVRGGSARRASAPAADAATVAAIDVTTQRIRAVISADLHATSTRCHVRVRG